MHSYGGALHIHDAVQALVGHSFHNNSVLLYGGGISITGKSTIELASLDFTQNKATLGGAVFIGAGFDFAPRGQGGFKY